MKKKLKKTWKGLLSACFYRHMDDSQGRAYELQQAAVKCMRGILFCYMRQADKVSVWKLPWKGYEIKLISSLILYIHFIMWASFHCQNIIFKFLFTHYRWSNSRKTSWGIIHCMSSLMSTLVTLWPQIQIGLIFKYEPFLGSLPIIIKSLILLITDFYNLQHFF